MAEALAAEQADSSGVPQPLRHHLMRPVRPGASKTVSFMPRRRHGRGWRHGAAATAKVQQPPPPREAPSRGTPPGEPIGTPPPPPNQAVMEETMAVVGKVQFIAGSEDERREILDLIIEHWGGVKKVLRKLDLCQNALAPFIMFCKGVSTELSLRRDRDERILNSIVLQAVVDPEKHPKHPLAQPGEGLVDIEILWKMVQRPPVGADWHKRFRAMGVMPISLQRHTTGVEPCAMNRSEEGPPYAICGDGDQMKAIVRQYFSQRFNRMKEVLQQHGDPVKRPGILTISEFRKAMAAVERYGTNKAELDALVGVIDPGSTGYVHIDDFLNMFGLEYLKCKSMRISVGKENNDGYTNTLQWPTSMAPEYRRKDVMKQLRERKMSPRIVFNSRSSFLRKIYGRNQREQHRKLEEDFQSLVPSPRRSQVGTQSDLSSSETRGYRDITKPTYLPIRPKPPSSTVTQSTPRKSGRTVSDMQKASASSLRNSQSFTSTLSPPPPRPMGNLSTPPDPASSGSHYMASKYLT